MPLHLDLSFNVCCFVLFSLTSDMWIWILSNIYYVLLLSFYGIIGLYWISACIALHMSSGFIRHILNAKQIFLTSAGPASPLLCVLILTLISISLLRQLPLWRWASPIWDGLDVLKFLRCHARDWLILFHYSRYWWFASQFKCYTIFYHASLQVFLMRFIFTDTLYWHPSFYPFLQWLWIMSCLLCQPWFFLCKLLLSIEKDPKGIETFSIITLICICKIGNVSFITHQLPLQAIIGLYFYFSIDLQMFILMIIVSNLMN